MSSSLSTEYWIIIFYIVVKIVLIFKKTKNTQKEAEEGLYFRGTKVLGEYGVSIHVVNYFAKCSSTHLNTLTNQQRMVVERVFTKT